ncbi:MAG: hypothetical protein L0Y58_19295 [Verrucomicrobia subdivision 3 bacterium]|nr:hypothetical protein [Limisphaerales bacterium]
MNTNCTTGDQTEILERLSEATHNVRKNPSFETAFLLREAVDDLKRSANLPTPGGGKSKSKRRS